MPSLAPPGIHLWLSFLLPPVFLCRFHSSHLFWALGVCFGVLPGQTPRICTKKKLKMNILKPWSRWKGLYASTMFMMMLMLSIRSSSIIMTFWCFCASWSETYRTCCVSLLSDPEVLTLYSSPVHSSVIPMYMSSANRDTPECFHMLVRTLKLLQKPSPWSVHGKAAVDRIKVKPDKGQEQCKVTHTTSVLGRDLKRNALWESSNMWRGIWKRNVLTAALEYFGTQSEDGDTMVRGLAPTEEHPAVITVTEPRRRRAHVTSDGEERPLEASPVACQQQRSSRDAIRLWRRRCSRNINQCKVERIIMKVWRYKTALTTQSKNRFHLSLSPPPPPCHVTHLWFSQQCKRQMTNQNGSFQIRFGPLSKRSDFRPNNNGFPYRNSMWPWRQSWLTFITVMCFPGDASWKTNTEERWREG